MEEVVETPETGNEEGNDGKEVTPVAEPETPPVEEEPETTPEEPEVTPEESEEIPEEPITGSDTKIMSVEPMAADVQQDATVTVNWYKDSKADANKLTEAPLTLTWLDGVNADGTKPLGGERKITFRLDDVIDGYTTAGLTVGATIKAGGSVTTDAISTITAANEVYELAPNVAAVPAGENTAAKPASFSGNVTFDIVVKASKTTVKLSEAADSTPVYMTNAEGKPDTTKEITATGGDQILTYDEATAEMKVAVKGMSDALKYRNIKVKTGASGAAETTLSNGVEEKVGTGNEAVTYTVFSFTPSGLDKFDPKADNTVLITVADAKAAKTLDLALDTDQGTNWTAGAITLTNAAKDFITVKEESGSITFDVSGVVTSPATKLDEDTLKVTTGSGQTEVTKPRVLAFTVAAKADAGLKLKGENPVTAEITGSDSFKKTVNATKVEATTNPAVAAHYEIDLSTAVTAADFANGGNLTLTVKVATEYDTTAAGVRTVTFTTDDGMKEVKAGAASNALAAVTGGSYTAKANEVAFSVEPVAGYSITKGTNYADDGNKNAQVATLTYDKVYKLEKKAAAGAAAGAATEYFTVTLPKEEEIVLTDGNGDGVYEPAAAFKFSDAAFNDGTDWQADGKIVGTENAATDLADGVVTEGKAAYTFENLTVTVKTEIETTDGGTVTVAANGISYQVSGDGIEKKSGAGNENKYDIDESATVLKLEMAFVEEPTVTFNTDKTAEVSGEAGAWTAEIPVTLFAKSGSAISDTITLSTTGKILSFASKTDGTLDGDMTKLSVKVNGADKNAAVTLPEGASAEVEITPKTGYAFTKVYSTLGEEETVYEIEADGSVVIPALVMSDNITITVEQKSVYAAVFAVDGDDDIEKDADGAYLIATGSNPLSITLYKGDATVAANKATVKYAKVYDGAAIAETKPAIDGGVVKFAQGISTKDTGVIRVDLMVAGSTQVVASVSIKQIQPAEELTLSKTEVTLMPDGDPAVLTMTPGEGTRLDWAAGDIEVEVVAAENASKPLAANDAKDTAARALVEASANYETGKLTITAKPAMTGSDAAAVVRVFNKTKRDAATAPNATDADKVALLASVTVKTTEPAVKLAEIKSAKEATGTKDSVKLELSVKNLTAIHAGKVYYEVTGLASVSGNSTSPMDVATGNKYFEKTPGTDTDVIEIKGLSSDKTYNIKVRLVQTLDAVTAPAAAAAANPTTLIVGTSEKEIKKAKTRAPRYETALKVKPASATIYTGQPMRKIAQAQFGAKTGYTGAAYVEFVNTKTGVIYGTKSSGDFGLDGLQETKASYYSFAATLDANGNVYLADYNDSLQKEYFAKDLGVKVTAESVDGDYAATAVIKLTEVNGINDIGFASGDYRTIYWNGRSAKIKLSPILNGGYKAIAPKSNKLTYTLCDNYGYKLGAPAFNLQGLEQYVKVDKSGNVSIDKKYEAAKNTLKQKSFKVKVEANDYAENTSSRYVTFEITEKPQTRGPVMVVRATDSNCDHFDVVVRSSGGVLKAEDFDVESTYGIRVVALKPGVPATKSSYTSSDFVDDVTYTSSAKAALSVDSEYGYLTFIKPQDKNVKLTLTAADGSPKNTSSIEVKLDGYQALGLQISQDGAYNNTFGPDVTEVTYDGSQNERFYLTVVKKANGEWVYNNDYTSAAISVKGAKILGKANYRGAEIVMTSSEATITLTDKAKKKTSYTYTIKQTPPADPKAKAPAIKMMTKLTAGMVEDVRKNDNDRIDEYKAGPDMLVFQVTNKAGNPENHAREYVLLTPDYSKNKKVLGSTEEWQLAKKYFLDNSAKKITQIDDNGRFTLNLNVAGEKAYDIVPGSYTLIATVGNYENGQFTPAAKSVNVKISLPGKKAKASLNLKGTYTMDVSAMEPVDLGAGHIITDYDWELKDTKVAADPYNFAMNKIDPKTGMPNNFKKYFKVVETGSSYKLQFQSGLDAAAIGTIDKKDLEGYVTVIVMDNGREIITKDMNIKVTLKEDKGLYAETMADAVYLNGENTVADIKIYPDKKSNTPVRLAAVMVSDDAKAKKEGGAEIVGGTNGVVLDTNQFQLKLKTAAQDKAGTYTVDLKVLAENSAYAVSKDVTDAKLAELVKTYGRNVTVKIKTVLKTDKTKKKVGIGLKSNKAVIGTNNFNLADPVDNSVYTVWVPVWDSYQGTTIKGATLEAKVGNKDFAGTGIIAMDTANSGIQTVNGQRYIKFTVNRKALIAENAKKSGAKVKFGANVSTAVKFTFEDANVAPEIVTLTLTMPKPMSFADVKKAVEKQKLAEKLGKMSAEDAAAANQTEVKSKLVSRIMRLFSAVIPWDAQVTWSVTMADGADGKYTAKVTIQDINSTDKLDIDGTFANYETVTTELTAMTTAIGTLQLQPTNEWSEADLKAAVEAGLKEAHIKPGRNITITVTKWKLIKATADKDGYVSATIELYDGKLKTSQSVTVGGKLNGKIAKLGNLADTKEAIATAIAYENGSGENKKGVNYNDVICNALDGATDLTGVEAALQTAIFDAAAAAIKNPAIKEKFTKADSFVEIAKDAQSSNPTTGTAKVKVDYKLPTKSATGWMKFKLTLKQDGMKDLSIDYTSAEIILPADDRMATLTETLTAVTGSGKLFASALTDGDADSSDTTVFNNATGTIGLTLECKTTAEVKTLLEAYLAENVKGTGITTAVTVSDKFKKADSNNASNLVDTDEVPGTGVTGLKVTGTITFVDTLKRERGAGAKTKEVVSFTGNVPDFSTRELTNMVIKAKNGETEVTNGLNNITIPGEEEEDTVLTFSAEVTGIWLTADDKKVTWELVEANTAASGGKLEEIPAKTTAGVTLTKNADGTATLTITKDAAADSTVYLRAALTMKKLNETDQTEITEANRVKIATITLKAATD